MKRTVTLISATIAIALAGCASGSSNAQQQIRDQYNTMEQAYNSTDTGAKLMQAFKPAIQSITVNGDHATALIRYGDGSTATETWTRSGGSWHLD